MLKDSAPNKDKDDPQSPVEWFNWVQDFTDSLTIRRAFMILMAGLMVSLTTLFYENRTTAFQAVLSKIFGVDTPTSNWEITEETQKQFKDLVQTSPLVKMIVITEVDLQKNRRAPRYWYLDDEKEADIRTKAATILPQAVFDYDPKNTQQMVAILQNEFVCSKFQDTIYNRFFPDMGKRMPVVCRIAIPPFYGRFVGVLSFGLEVVPTKEELDSIRIEMSRVAVEVYLRDIVRRPPPKS